jgi:DNA (cytosine-5)-methyltransferase 1
MMLKFTDLFAGIGGTRLGLEQASKILNFNTECVLSSEIDPNVSFTYKLNFNEEPLGDIYKINSLPDFDFLLAGFPCQPFSYAGKQKGFGDMRGTLFFEIKRILNEKKPRGFLLENVRGLINNDNKRTFKTILHSLNKLGYGVSYLLLNSSNYGVPQNRVRLYIMGLNGRKTPKLTIKSDVGATDSHKYKSKKYQTTLTQNGITKKVVGEILEGFNEKYKCSDKFIKLLSKVVGNNYESLHGYRLIDYRGGNSIHSWELGIKGDCTKEEIDFINGLISNRRKKKFGEEQDGKKLTIEQIKTFYNNPNLENILNSLVNKGYISYKDGKYNPVCGNMSFEIFKFLDPDSISITLTASDCHKLGVVQNNTPRRITPRECARLQGFPDSFILHPDDTHAYHQIGNSVSVPVVKEVLVDYFKNNWNNFDLEK